MRRHRFMTACHRADPWRALASLLLLISSFLSTLEPAWAALPPGWSDADIGSPALAGSAAYTNGNWTVIGGGSGILNNADQFNLARTSFSADGVMIARILSLQNSDADIGSPALAGSAAYTNGNWTVIGGGSDIWNN